MELCVCAVSALKMRNIENGKLIFLLNSYSRNQMRASCYAYKKDASLQEICNLKLLGLKAAVGNA